MEGLRAYRLLPVPMRLDDPRWRCSWRQKPCLVYHVSEGRARGAAARFFAVGGWVCSRVFPWNDPALVMCEACEIAGRDRLELVPRPLHDRGVESTQSYFVAPWCRPPATSSPGRRRAGRSGPRTRPAAPPPTP